MIELTTPKVECIGIADNYGRFSISPLAPGYGLTIGNALRRVLLSSLEGAAITSVQIEGARHEFMALPGVKEDVTDIILNIKRIRVRSYSDRPVTLRLEATGPKVVTAADIRPHADVDIVSLDQPIATLDSEDATLSMQLTVQKGRGYVPAESQDFFEIGRIPVDAIYSPVTKVNYVVERTRVGQRTDYDNLIIEIWTDGTIAPGEALSQAASILVGQFQIIAAYANAETSFGIELPTETMSVPEVDNRSIDELGLSARTLNSLKRAHITTVGQVLSKTKDDLLSIRNFGDKSLHELEAKLKEFGYLPSDLPEGAIENAPDDQPIGVLARSSSDAVSVSTSNMEGES
ncbi:DNA-directed RNA polymerase subunit alpha [Thermobaculum terrenum]|uniref:DNA-directed RNA polymerase subunit alpha n=1 Tax=Thermobaculum terrenum TaxID=166501 RepID=UPI0002FE8BDD|nr:DNA-directed RNA polymerase subunit alpha [Thermobaculum terrenum]